MAKLTRESVVAEALELLDEVGLDAVSTRQLAKRLGVEQPSLYWHFRKKEELLRAMAEAAMAPHATAPLPTPPTRWSDWFRENARSVRRTLLMRRDGARLHAGSFPGEAGLDRISHKVAFLLAAGLPERDAQIAMLTAGRFAVGSVLEEQADLDGHGGRLDNRHRDGLINHEAEVLRGPRIDHESAFEEGLALIVDGLAHRVNRLHAP